MQPLYDLHIVPLHYISIIVPRLINFVQGGGISTNSSMKTASEARPFN
jgi:hypothetical protein